MILAGLGSNGTEAAAQMVTSPALLRVIDRTLPHGRAKQNGELALKTSVVDGRTGTPSIQAFRIW
jgi:hypothetical protein